MAKILNKGYTDSVVTTKNVAVPDLNWTTDFKVKQDEPTEAILANVTSPLDRPESIRFGYTDIKDVYKGTSIDPSVYAPTRRGMQILAQVNDIYSVSSDTDATYRIDLPVSAHVVIKIPACELLTADVVNALALRAVATLYNKTVVTSEKLAAMTRGVLIP